MELGFHLGKDTKLSRMKHDIIKHQINTEQKFLKQIKLS